MTNEYKVKATAMMQFFSYTHLPEILAAKSKPFHDLAKIMVESVPANEEMLMGMRKLLEAKDCMVRAVITNKQPYKGELKPKAEIFQDYTRETNVGTVEKPTGMLSEL